jgi:hypothetical protein
MTTNPICNKRTPSTNKHCFRMFLGPCSTNNRETLNKNIVDTVSCLPCRTWCNIIIIIINCNVCILALAAAMHVSTAHAIFVSCGQRSFCQETAPIAHFCLPVVAEIALETETAVLGPKFRPKRTAKTLRNYPGLNLLVLQQLAPKPLEQESLVERS